MDFNKFRSIFQYPSADPNYFNSNVHFDFQTLGFEMFKEEYMSMSFNFVAWTIHIFGKGCNDVN